MRHHSTMTFVVIGVVIFVALLSAASMTTAQVMNTFTSTQTSNLYLTSTSLTTITSSTFVYTTTTEATNSTIQGTQTRYVPATTTITSTFMSTVGTGLTVTSVLVLTSVSTQTAQILGNIWGESLAAVLATGGIISFLMPEKRPRPPKGIICKNCGNVNPPFARAFCVKCGHSLQESV